MDMVPEVNFKKISWKKMEENSMKKGLLISFVAFLFAIVFAGIYLISTANDLTDMKNLAKRYEADIQTELQSRFDKVPNLAEIVKSADEHEENIINAIADARKQYNNALSSKDTEGMLEADEALNIAIHDIEENYPKIASLDLYKNFMDEYSGIEAAVTIARKNYNEVVMEYNSMIDHIPTIFVAKIMGLEHIQEFKASEEANNSVEIDMTD